MHYEFNVNYRGRLACTVCCSFGDPHPYFFLGSLNDAIKEALDCPVVDVIKTFKTSVLLSFALIVCVEKASSNLCAS